MNKILIRICTCLLITFPMVLTIHAGTWGAMSYNSGKWGATPDVYTITMVETGYNTGELVITFSLDETVTAAPETEPTSFSVTCGDVTVESTGSPVTLTGLTPDVDYDCTVVATNATGSSTASIGFIGTPEEAAYRSGILKLIIMKKSIDSQGQ